jgi:hypothetical protein
MISPGSRPSVLDVLFSARWCGRGPIGSGALAALATLLPPGGAHAQELNGVAHRFLERHGVPCPLVLEVDGRHDLGEVATCQDGREWVLFWLEDEIAFVHPQTRESYRWDRAIYRAHPELFTGPAPRGERLVLSHGP